MLGSPASSSFPVLFGPCQYTAQGLGELTIFWHGFLKSGYDCFGILAKIPYWLCDFCVVCSQNQAIVRVVTKEVWTKRFGFAKGMEEGERVEGRMKEEEWHVGGGGNSVTIWQVFGVLEA